MIPLPLISLGASLLSGWQRIFIYAVAIAAVVGMIWFHGWHKGSLRLYEYQAEQLRAAAAIVIKRGAVTEKIVNHYIKVKGDTQTVTVTVEKEVERYADTNPGYCLDAGWRRLHDAAAANTVPPAAVNPDGEGGAPQAAAALQTVTGNYSLCHQTADRLDALQDWVREQSKINP